MGPTGGWRGGGCVGLRSEEGSWGRGDAPDRRRRQGFWDATARTRVRECVCVCVSKYLRLTHANNIILCMLVWKGIFNGNFSYYINIYL